MTRPRAPSGQRAEAAMAVLLRVGVVAAASIVIVGGAAFLATHGAAVAHMEVFRGEPPSLRHVSSILAGVALLDPRSMIMLGLLVLIATPILRVMFSVIVFLLERDGAFVAITLFVLAVLLVGLVHG